MFRPEGVRSRTFACSTNIDRPCSLGSELMASAHALPQTDSKTYFIHTEEIKPWIGFIQIFRPRSDNKSIWGKKKQTKKTHRNIVT